MCTVIGPAGMGKTRLIAELLAQVEGQARVVRGRCLSYGEGITYWPAIEIVRQAVEVGDDASVEEVEARLAALVGGTDSAERVAARLCELMGLRPPAATAEEMVWAFRKLLEASSRVQPLVVVFDDIHWAEPALLDLIDHVAESGQRHRGSSWSAQPGRICWRTGPGGGAANPTRPACCWMVSVMTPATS